MKPTYVLGALAALSLTTACGTGNQPPTIHHDNQPDAAYITGDPNRDDDGDGVTAANGDCNPADPTIYPGAPELCDGKDHDCNGIVDDTCDDDKDGYAILASDKLPGGDCNDQDPLISPGAVEVPATRSTTTATASSTRRRSLATAT